MSFTPISIQGLFSNSDGSAATGYFTATPNSTMVNDGIELSQAPIAGVINGAGQIAAQSQFAFVVTANDDSGTTPPASNYTFSIAITSGPLIEFDALVPHICTATEANGATTITNPVVQLSTLLASPSMVGQDITGTNIPGGTTVLSVDQLLNQITLSANATATQASGCEFVIGGCIEIETLQANAL
jgi:hypothetical protein